MAETCTMQCLQQNAVCVGPFAEGSQCRPVPGGLTCLGPCQAMQRNCFGKRDPVDPSQAQKILLWPNGINNTNFTGARRGRAEPMGWLDAQEGPFGRDVGPTVVVERRCMGSLPQQATSAIALASGTRFAPLLYGQMALFMLFGQPSTQFTAYTGKNNVCQKVNNGGRNASIDNPLNDGCLFSRPWVPISADNMVGLNAGISYGDLFMLQDGYNIAGSRKFLSYCLDANRWQLRSYDDATLFMILPGWDSGPNAHYRNVCTFTPGVASPAVSLTVETISPSPSPSPSPSTPTFHFQTRPVQVPVPGKAATGSKKGNVHLDGDVDVDGDGDDDGQPGLSQEKKGIMWILWLVLLAVVLALLGIGLYFARRQQANKQ